MQGLVLQIDLDLVHILTRWHLIGHLAQLIGNIVQVVLCDVARQLWRKQSSVIYAFQH